MHRILVLQWTAGNHVNLERLVQCENAIMAVLGDTAEIDGHDWGVAEMNIFILTKNPADTFDQIKPTLQAMGVFDSMRAAFRCADAEDYTILSPSGLAAFAVL